MKRIAAVLIIAALSTFSSLTLAPSTARAQVEFDGSQAAGATFAAGLLTGMVCWTVELATAEHEDEDGIPKEKPKDDYDRRGWYAGLSGAYALEFIDEGEETESQDEAFTQFIIDYDVTNRHSGGVQVRGGRRCHPRFAVELEVEWLDDFEGEVDAKGVGKVRDLDIGTVNGSVNVKGYALTGRIQPYGLLGVGVMQLRADAKNTGDGESTNQETGVLIVRGGGGVDFYIDRNWVLNTGIEYVYSATNVQILDYLAIGLGVQYRW